VSEPATTPLTSVYLGTSEFAATILRGLAAGPHRPSLVVTPPDRRSGRGRRVGPPPAAVAARELGLDLLQADDVNEDGSRRAVLALEPDVATVCAFGQLIREPLLSELTMLNLHPSLLPRWRGAAPIERAIMAGDDRTGVCVIRLTAGLDSGPVARRREIGIGPSDDYGSLALKLAAAGAGLLSDALDSFGRGELEFADQSDDGVTYAEKIEPAERRVDTDRDAGAEALRVRALTPHIGAYAGFGESRLGLREVVAVGSGPEPGRFAATEERDALLLGCGAGALRIGNVQPQGKRWMAAGDYLRGYGVPGAAGSERP
jgi:methionyl-tRNA formyltransferase